MSGFDQAISDLHSRIADLQGSVGDIGSAAPPPAYPPPPPASAPPPPAPDPYAPPPPADPYGGFPPPPPTVADPYAQPDPYAPPPPPAYPPPDYGAPPPAGEYAEPYRPVPPEESDALGNFFRVDVGPFEDLLAMTAFEEQLSALPSMADVRVRRFGARRAEIELELIGQVPLAHEMLRVAPDAETMIQPDGTLTVELRAEQWTGGAAEPALADELEAEPGELPPEQGGERG